MLFTNVQITSAYPFTKLVSTTKNRPFFCIRKETSQILTKIQLYLSFRTSSRKYLVTIVRAFEESTYINSKNCTNAVAFIYHSYKNIDDNEFDLSNLSYRRVLRLQRNETRGRKPVWRKESVWTDSMKEILDQGGVTWGPLGDCQASWILALIMGHSRKCLFALAPKTLHSVSLLLSFGPFFGRVARPSFSTRLVRCLTEDKDISCWHN